MHILIGTNQSHNGSTKCMPCPAGTAAADPGSTVCGICQKGRYQNTSGAPQCIPCDKGHYCGSVYTVYIHVLYVCKCM